VRTVLSLHSPVSKFGGMRLTELPSELFRMTNLKQLWLADNNVGSLPSEIALLSKLELLNVRESKVDDRRLVSDTVEHDVDLCSCTSIASSRFRAFLAC
jgi:hypothetical protein